MTGHPYLRETTSTLRPIVQAIARFVLPFLRADSGLLFSHNPLGPVDTTDNGNNKLTDTL